MSADSYARIYAVVRRIPRGRVATYGQVAALAGLPHAPRVAGYALHALPEGSPLPWHRVVAAGGKLSLGRLSPHGAITQRLRIPTIGIGAGAGCSGQVQVITDLLGLDSWRPKHARAYADLRGIILEAVRAYVSDVAAGTFPGPSETVRMDDDVLADVLGRSSMDAAAAIPAEGIPLDRDL